MQDPHPFALTNDSIGKITAAVPHANASSSLPSADAETSSDTAIGRSFTSQSPLADAEWYRNMTEERCQSSASSGPPSGCEKTSA